MDVEISKTFMAQIDNMLSLNVQCSLALRSAHLVGRCNRNALIAKLLFGNHC